MPRVVLLVNELAELTPIMATTLLGHRAAQRGWETWFVGVDSLGWERGLLARGRRVQPDLSPVELVAELRARPGVTASPDRALELGPGDLLLMRTNPARDPARAERHRAALHLAVLARDRGVLVLNDPENLDRVGSKLFLLELPESVRPRQVVSADYATLRAFAEREAGPVVLKPLWGTRGVGVARVDLADEPRFEAVAKALLDDGHVVAQEYLLEAPEGDTRVLMLEGHPIQVSGKTAAVRRVPAKGEFRSNVHLGGKAAPAPWNPTLAAVAEAVGPTLRARGIFLAGLDVVGSKVVEVNVFAPGGFANASEHAGVDFLGPVLEALARRF